MRGYLIRLTLLTLVLVLACFALLWWASNLFIVAMPLTALYFAIITAVQHHIVTRAAHKDPRVFIRTFLGSTVATLLLHLAVMSAYMFTNTATAYRFVIAFAVCYVVYLVYETIELVRYVKLYQKEIEKNKQK